jgi:putative intracellular protease/amidase
VSACRWPGTGQRVTARPKRVAIVLTNHGQFGDTGKPTGFYLSEASHPHTVFRAAGWEVDFLLPKRGGVVAAVCHGPAALVNARLSDGAYLVAGKEVSSFTDEEEAAVKLEKVVPFALESRLRERGARFVEAPNFERKVAVSGRLVTGQNPASATGVAEETVRLAQSRH